MVLAAPTRADVELSPSCRAYKSSPPTTAPGPIAPAADRIASLSPTPPTESRSCRLRHRQDSGPVAYAIDRLYWCRWRSRQVAFEVDGVADRRGSAPCRRAGLPGQRRSPVGGADRTVGTGVAGDGDVVADTDVPGGADAAEVRYVAVCGPVAAVLGVTVGDCRWSRRRGRPGSRGLRRRRRRRRVRPAARSTCSKRIFAADPK